ncbi:MAG: aminotransferase DegT [Dehalococcoidales bacterium]|jgi:perosamine synthetase|nr:aminotransferase DegT [Dehalococcoidales bacterium]|tara:strand:+ start:434 stop:1564 length:1131 start_codon:yes stop_codon:yes gene_type:complete
MNWKIPLFKIYWDEEDVRMVTDAVQRGMFWAMGPNIEKFEEMLADYIGVKYAVVFNSGTSALHAAPLSCGIGKGDEVIVPSFTFIATANTPLFVGAKPVFADIEEKTYGLDPEDVEGKITPRTKAILPIHYGGSPCFMHELKQVAERHNLLLIEDVAESFGAAIGGNKAGSFGDCATLSFCANKVITTGEGGAVVTDSAEIYEKLKLIRSHGRAETANYFSSTEYTDYVTLGYNFRMSDITAALGIAQLKKINKIIEMRRRNAEKLSVRLSGITGIEVPHSPDSFFHVYQIYVIRVKDGQEKRDALLTYLGQKGIMSKVYFPPVHFAYFYRKTLGYHCALPVTEKISRQVLTLPMYPSLTEDEIDYITDEIAAFFS